MLTIRADSDAERIDAPLVCSARLVDRTHGLFGLLVSACEGSMFRASQRLSIDRRTIESLCSAPSLRLVSRIGDALGLDVGQTAGVLAAESGARRSVTSLREAILESDLADDPRRLEELAGALQRWPSDPADLGLAHLVLARAAVARGDPVAARRAISLSLDLGFAAADRALVHRLAQAIGFELALATPWCDSGTDDSRDHGLDRIIEISAPGGHGHDPDHLQRIAAWREGVALAAPDCDEAAALARLRSLIERASSARARAWVASIAALSALQSRVRRRGEGAAIETIVAAEFVLEEGETGADRTAAPLFFRRRTRVALAEWHARAALGEVDGQTIDALDKDELTRALMWFPASSRSCALREIGRMLCQDDVAISQREA